MGSDGEEIQTREYKWLLNVFQKVNLTHKTTEHADPARRSPIRLGM